MEKLKPIKSTHAGFLCCPNNEQLLPMRTRLYNGFGGYTVTKNGEMFFVEDQDKDFDECKTVIYIENKAKKEPDADWQINLMLPLRSGRWQRQGKSKWVLVEEGEGFA